MKLRIAWLCLFAFVLFRAFQARPELLELSRFREHSPFERHDSLKRVHLATNRFSNRIDLIRKKVAEPDSATYRAKDANTFAAFSSDGSIKWEFEPIGYSQLPRMTSWTGRDLVFVGMQNGPLYALNKADGAVVWTINAIMVQFNQMPLPFENSLIYIIDRDSAPESFAIRVDQMTGEIIWQSDFFRTHSAAQPVYETATHSLFFMLTDGRNVRLSTETGSVLSAP